MKHVVSLILLGALVALLAATGLARAEDISLRVGDQKAGLKALLEVSGLAKDLPYKVQWSEFPAAAPILEALNTGALDVGYTGDLAFLTVYSAGAPIRAIGGTRSAARSQAILVPKDSPARTIADLKGKRLAGNKGGWGQFLILAVLEQAGIPADQVKWSYLGPIDARAALLSGAVDGWAIWEPYVSTAIMQDGARVIADGTGLTPTITFLVANQQAIASRRAALADFRRRLYAAWAWGLEHIPEYAAYNAGLTGLSAPIVARAYEDDHRTPLAIDDAVIAEVQQAADRSTRYGILLRRVDVAAAIDRSFDTPALSQ
ncbi:ABC transporter substrate-binding protein [Aliidongia dinghuensis]|uniref:Putative aliphatic sulfonates-binding protein n=1 Tax=Aliidongia dinghuensis TaxID=1867774 RepID=A0A8J2Z0Z1_9PROT|nr:ABC transporter substrate-binding protein [Aliidongia dinghuensis]GGF44656.1 ABC transporter substrate-binding protein [Aliidongia dinghuensis]